jgi:hypothetical protein
MSGNVCLLSCPYELIIARRMGDFYHMQWRAHICASGTIYVWGEMLNVLGCPSPLYMPAGAGSDVLGLEHHKFRAT